MKTKKIDKDKKSIISSERLPNYTTWARETVKKWHDKANPEYIFLTETSAIPMGYLLKATWKKAYPGEKNPKFYRINPHAIYDISKQDPQAKERGHVTDQNRKQKEMRNYLEKRIKNKNASIIVYDESQGEKISTTDEPNILPWPKKGEPFKSRPSGRSAAPYNEGIHRALLFFEDEGMNNLWFQKDHRNGMFTIFKEVIGKLKSANFKNKDCPK